MVIEAVQWTGDYDKIVDFIGYQPEWKGIGSCAPEQLEIITLEGMSYASMNDWIIKGIQGEFYPCKPDIFAESYDEVD